METFIYSCLAHSRYSLNIRKEGRKKERKRGEKERKRKKRKKGRKERKEERISILVYISVFYYSG